MAKKSQQRTQGDRARFERLFRAHYRDIERYVRRRVRNGIPVDDAVAETFTIAWRKLEAVPPDALPWLYATAHHVVANESRAEHRRIRLAAEAAQQAKETTSDEVSADGAVLAALAQLPERDREALLLVAWEGLSRRDAAKTMGISAASIAGRIYRARRTLGRLLKADTIRPDPTQTQRDTAEDIG